MSSRGTVPAWVIEKQQKQIALEREAKRRKQVRQQIATVVAEVRTKASALNTQEIRTWARRNLILCNKLLTQQSLLLMLMSILC